MQEIYFPLQAGDVKPKAEELRKKGRTYEAVSTVGNVLNIMPEDYPRLDHRSLTLMLMAARIYVDGFNSLAGRAKDARETAAHLASSKGAISRIYHNPHIEKSAPDMHEDIDGSAYEFSTAMARDEARYLVILANLTGNTAFLTAASQKLETAIEKAKEPSEKTLAQFERDRLAYTGGSLPGNFYRLRLSYQRAMLSARENKNWERVATIAARFAMDLWKNGRRYEAVKTAEESLKVSLKDPSVRSILPREVLKNLTEARRIRRWRKTTPPGVNFEYLQID